MLVTRAAPRFIGRRRWGSLRCSSRPNRKHKVRQTTRRDAYLSALPLSITLLLHLPYPPLTSLSHLTPSSEAPLSHSTPTNVDSARKCLLAATTHLNFYTTHCAYHRHSHSHIHDNAPPSDPGATRPPPATPRLSSHNLRLSTTTASPSSAPRTRTTSTSQLLDRRQCF